MSYPNAPVCDVCGIVKRETNHWFRAIQVRPAGTMIIVALGDAFTLGDVWDVVEGETTILDICGEECLHKFVSAQVQASKSRKGEQQCSNSQQGEPLV